MLDRLISGAGAVTHLADRVVRAFANVTGGLVSGYVETNVDHDRDGIQQPDERGRAWNYVLVDRTSRAVVTVSSGGD